MSEWIDLGEAPDGLKKIAFFGATTIVVDGQKIGFRESPIDGKTHMYLVIEDDEGEQVRKQAYKQVRRQKTADEQWEELMARAPKNEREMWEELFRNIHGKWRTRANLYGVFFGGFLYKYVSWIEVAIYFLLLGTAILVNFWDVGVLIFFFGAGILNALIFIPDLLGIGHYSYTRDAWWGVIFLTVPLFFVYAFYSDPTSFTYLKSGGADSLAGWIDRSFDDLFLVVYLIYMIFFLVPAVGVPSGVDIDKDKVYPHLYKKARRKLKKWKKKYGVKRLTVSRELVEWWLGKQAGEAVLGVW